VSVVPSVQTKPRESKRRTEDRKRRRGGGGGGGGGIVYYMGFLCFSGKSSKRSENSNIDENNSNIKRKDQTQLTSGS